MKKILLIFSLFILLIPVNSQVLRVSPVYNRVSVEAGEPPDTADNFEVSSPNKDSIQLEVSYFDVTADSFRVNYKGLAFPTNRTDGTLKFAFNLSDTSDYHDTTFLYDTPQDTVLYFAMWSGKQNQWTLVPNKDTVAVDSLGTEIELYDGLISVYALEEGGTGDFLDSYGSYDLTYTGAPTRQQAGINNYCTTFDGDDVIGNAGIHELTTFSISCWVKTTNDGNYKGIVSNYEVDKGYSLIKSNANKFEFAVGNAVDGEYVRASTTSINTGDWFHLVATFVANEADNVHIYVNGSEENAGGSWAHAPSDFGTYFIIGLRGSFFWTGSIDEVYIYNRELTSDEVTGLYAAGAGKFYPFE